MRRCRTCQCTLGAIGDGRLYCRMCNPHRRRSNLSIKEMLSSDDRRDKYPVYTCERCGRITREPLVMQDDDLVCRVCRNRGPDPTIEEIYRMAALIREERGPDWRHDGYGPS